MTENSYTLLAATLAGCGGWGGGSRDNAMNASVMNSFRFSTVFDMLALHVRAQPESSISEFFELCISLARHIDFAIASKKVPTKAPELPSLFKQVCQRKYDPTMEIAIMVLMASAKSASQSGWFSEKDSQDICHLANEISSNICSTTDFKSEASGSLSIISTIMTRFFPTMKIGHILAFLEVKPGFGAFVNAFHIARDVDFSPEEKIMLLVAQADNMETSSCLISPPQVNFLINGSEVKRRTAGFMDSGPQAPTLISNMLECGANLLQAVGEFNGKFIIVVAYISMMSTPGPATLQNYVLPAPALEDPELDIIVGPSRISLNCPISFKRIKTPIKGHSCKHLKCFDYDNYVSINSKRPSWRCPHCNQHVCFTDIRFDQSFFKVLKEVTENVTDVIIYSDGSWKAIIESDGEHHNHPNNNSNKQMPDTSPEFAEGEMGPPYCNPHIDILDLTALDNNEKGTEDEIVDQKESQTKYQGQPCTNYYPFNAVGEDFWSTTFLSTFGLGSAPNQQTTNSISASMMHGGVGGPSPRNTLPLHWPQSGNSPNSPFSYGMHQQYPTIPYNVNTLHELQQLHRLFPSSAHPTQQLNSSQRTPYLTTQSQRAPARSYASSGIGRSNGAFQHSMHAPRPLVNPTRGDQSRNIVGRAPVDSTGWRPASRMRGSLSGQAYDDALGQYLIHHPPRAQSNTPANVSPQLQALIANRVGHASASLVNHSSTG
ncbi:unnamed protein product [Cuscuta europaea]|uniref:SP-RING-type domain-containing protein n=2 Tax=Cuscuta europaea TaxID=41803 RepID=A0A9P0ZLQ3_CUSEU|nr:unnamed protein product [Cuscuta europaea]